MTPAQTLSVVQLLAEFGIIAAASCIALAKARRLWAAALAAISLQPLVFFIVSVLIWNKVIPSNTGTYVFGIAFAIRTLGFILLLCAVVQLERKATQNM